MELICGACHGRMLAEAPGSTVACPHCGTLLQTPADPAPGAPETFFAVSEDGPAAGPDPAFDTVRLDAWDLPGSGSPAAPAAETFQEHAASGVPSGAFSGFSTSGSSVDLDVAPPQLVPVIRVSETGSVVVAAAEPAAPPADVHVGSQPEPAAAPAGIEVGTAADIAAQQAPEATTAPPIIEAGQIDSASEAPAPTTRFLPEGAAVTGETRPVIEREAAEVNSAPEAPVAAGVPRILFLMVFSYASAITLLCMYLIWTRPSTTDLPDLAPKITPKTKKKGVTVLQYWPPQKTIAPSNILRLGESRQFGSLRVTPLAVTRGSVEFAFYKPDVNETRAPEGPVLKLHLRFDNVSADQEFNPLDWQLVFTKKPVEDEYGAFIANNFVCNAADRSQLEKHVYVFDMPEHSNWLMKGLNLDHEIGPGESFECFIPTTEDQIDTLSGDLVWRVHFRKGYNPQSFRGVTTLIEVMFRSSDIIDEAPAPGNAAAKEA